MRSGGPLVLRLVLGGLASLMLLSACEPTSLENSSPPGQLVDEGSWYSRQEWPHDGRPVESANFLVFSDSASPEARSEAAAVAEKIWADLLRRFDVEPEMLQFPEGQSRIHIYAYRGYYPQDWGMRAYYGGFIMWSPDHPQRSNSPSDYGPVVEHELVHVLESLLKGRDGGVGEMTDAWFAEGIAEHVSGGTAGGTIRDFERLDELTAEYGRLSPVSFKRDAQVTVPEAGYYFNYPTYQLAVEMLMDDSGLGMTNQDVRNLYVDMAAGATFEAAFDAHAPVDLATYESEFYDLAEVYLPEHRSWPTSPTGLVAVAVAIAGAMVGLMRLGYSRSVATDTAEPGRAVSITHRAMTVAMAGVAIVFYVAILSILGNAHELNNEMEASVRLLAYVIVNVFLVLAAGLVYLSMRHWRRPTRRSLLIAPSILVLAVVTFLVLAVVV